jgi:site-specific DNA-methyltransferase (adenine-specific)
MTPYYEEAGITIYHADCRQVLDDVAADVVVTDPPYGISLEADYSKSYGVEVKVAAERKSHAPVHGDTEPFDPTPLLRFPHHVLFGANYYRDRLPDAGGWIVWDKVCSNDVRRLPGWSDGEVAWTDLVKGIRIFRHAWNGFSRSSENSVHVHPTQKPVALMRWVLDRWVPPDWVILDPYMGSGPLARAAQEMGRRYIGVEIEESYCEVAVGRLRQGVFDFGAAS